MHDYPQTRLHNLAVCSLDKYVVGSDLTPHESSKMKKAASISVLFVAIAAAFTASQARDAEQRPSSELTRGWHIVRTNNPQTDTNSISIMHTADTSRSDLDFAGLMIRCSDDHPEVVIVVIRPFPLHARLHVVFGKLGNETQFEATVAPPGTAIVIPTDATALITKSWQSLNDLLIQVGDGQAAIRGVVILTGLQAAFNELVASCHGR